MTPFPTDIQGATSILIGAAINGFAPDGQHGDKRCCIQAGWNVEGFALGQLWPHDHPDLKTPGKKATKASAPRGEKAQLKKLVKLLEPVGKPRPQADGQPLTPEGQPVTAPDLAALPWAEILMLARLLLEAWLKSRK